MNLETNKEVFAIHPRTGEKIYKTNDILSYGFSETENKGITQKLPANCILRICEKITDLIAFPNVYRFVNPMSLTTEDIEMLAHCEIECMEDL